MSDNALDNDDFECDPYPSGPYCRHWLAPDDCEKVCATCGHRCEYHTGDTYCNFEECTCDGWEQKS